MRPTGTARTVGFVCEWTNQPLSIALATLGRSEWCATVRKPSQSTEEQTNRNRCGHTARVQTAVFACKVGSSNCDWYENTVSLTDLRKMPCGSCEKFNSRVTNGRATVTCAMRIVAQDNCKVVALLRFRVWRADSHSQDTCSTT